jgi:hypothetical protein
MARSGRLRPTDLVLREGRQLWQPAKTAKDIEDGAPSPSTSPAMMPPVGGAIGRPSMAMVSEAIGGELDRPVPAARGVNVGQLLFGVFLCGGGILLTAICHRAAAAIGCGSYIVFTGPIVYGLLKIFSSFGKQIPEA